MVNDNPRPDDDETPEWLLNLGALGIFLAVGAPSPFLGFLHSPVS